MVFFILKIIGILPPPLGADILQRQRQNRNKCPPRLSYFERHRENETGRLCVHSVTSYTAATWQPETKKPCHFNSAQKEKEIGEQ